ncbi:universal stress protein [Pararhodobacter zhoushanensis]|uniref:Universal stress protein n=1 Tax=Pararhodobacter zhoushanensis TaxID=2479545 RepID=A0ABT3GYA1_9RHOB|nr:universal stress protein [Pararhodobacter zhoushanensis]MCW1932534.1 universal stress protein [Pararhodobacter zhoushanensis]
MYTNIIVAVDLSHGEAGKALIAKAEQLLDDGGVIRLLHVLEDVPTYIAAELPRDLNDRRQAEAKVELALLSDGKSSAIQTEIRTGAAASQILQCADDTGADLIMIASHRPGLSDYFIGSTAARVVRHAQCSVLISR